MLKTVDASAVLELGAGDYSYKYCRDLPNGSWTTLDFDEPCDIRCDLNSQRLTLPFQSGTFNLVICTEVLEHLLWPQTVLKEIHRVLSPDGRVLISVPNITSLTYRIAWLIGHIPSCAAAANLPLELNGTAYETQDGTPIGGHVIDFSKARLLRLLELANFRPLRLRGSGVIRQKQLLKSFLVPVSLASNIICLAEKSDHT